MPTVEETRLLVRVAAEHGTPCYVYLMDAVLQRVQALRAAFEGRFKLGYAVKTNPHPAILERLRGTVDLLDVSSGGELSRALACGWKAEELGFTGPGKSRTELELAARERIGAVVIESVEEAQELDAQVARLTASERQPVLVRIAPARLPRGFGVRMAGRPTPFGIDEEDIGELLPRILGLPHIEVVGLHAYSGTQCLDAAALAENYAILAELFGAIARDHDLRPQKLVFGAGLGIPYHEGDEAVDLGLLAEHANPVLDGLRAEEQMHEAELVLELGRYLVGEAGYYVTRVVRVKHSRGAEIAVCDGGMNHNLGACGHLGGVIHRNYPLYRLGEDAGSEERTYDVVGPLCTSIDILGRAVRLPALEAGDLIGVGCSGAYGPSASPLGFIGHPPPREVLVEGGEALDVSPSG